MNSRLQRLFHLGLGTVLFLLLLTGCVRGSLTGEGAEKGPAPGATGGSSQHNKDGGFKELTLRFGPYRQVVEQYWLSDHELVTWIRSESHDSLVLIDVEDSYPRPLAELPSTDVYMLDALAPGFGAVYQSYGNEIQAYWLKGDKVEPFPGVVFYALSPSRSQAVLFGEQPALFHFQSRQRLNLPTGITHGWPVYKVGLKWSPAEDMLLYEDWSDNSIVIIDTISGKEKVRLKEKGWSLIEGTWSPDATKVAFLAWRDGEQYDWEGDARPPVGHRLGIFDLQNEEVAWTEVPSSILGPPLWSPDGDRLVFPVEIPAEIWSVDSDGKNLRRLRAAGGDILAQSPWSWSPGGKRLLIRTNCGERNSEEPGWVALDLTSGQEQQIASNVNEVDWIDEDQLLFSEPVEPGSNRWRLQLARWAGTPTTLAESIYLWDFAVSPGRDFVAYSAGEDGDQYLVVTALVSE